MMKTNWNSTWPVIYQSPAAKDVASCLRGDSTLFFFLKKKTKNNSTLNVPSWGQTRASQRETERRGERGNVYFSGRGAKIWIAVMLGQHRLCKRKWTVQRGTKAVTWETLEGDSRRFFTTMPFHQSCERHQAILTLTQRCLTRSCSIGTCTGSTANTFSPGYVMERCVLMAKESLFFSCPCLIYPRQKKNSQGNSADMKSV